MKKILICILCLNMITTVANAQEDKNIDNKPIVASKKIQPYAGMHLMISPSMEISINDASEKSSAYGFDVAFGIKKEILRGEVEIKYLSGWQTKDSSSAGSILEKESTNASNVSVMTNFYIDIPVASNDKIEPFIMAGIGVSEISIKGNYETKGYTVDSYNPCAGMPVSLCTSYNVYTYDYFDDNYEYKSNPLLFAYQLGMGFSYKLADNLVLDCMYKYFGTFQKDADITVSDGTTSAKGQAKIKTSNHELLFGGRLMF